MNIIKKIFHVRYFGSMIGFYLGIKGYNRATRIVTRAGGQISFSTGFANLIPSFNSRVNKGADLSVCLLREPH